MLITFQANMVFLYPKPRTLGKGLMTIFHADPQESAFLFFLAAGLLRDAMR